MNHRWMDIPAFHMTRTIFGRLFKMLAGRKADFTLPAAWQANPIRGRSLAIRVVDCGSNGAAEQEMAAIFNPVYDAERFGLHLVTSPRHADVLLVSGPLARNMEAALLAALEAMPEPRRVVTIGDDLSDQSVFADTYGVIPLPPAVLAVRVAHIPGNPPAPAEILAALLAINPR
jgi:Ni,Fe-hydrogenase III small subunit